MKRQKQKHTLGPLSIHLVVCFLMKGVETHIIACDTISLFVSVVVFKIKKTLFCACSKQFLVS